ncbi:hypothetical protein [Cellulosimicrobium cellulans]|uniref:hypothetical protein n=1 Tax=Cellulosimicrobium cellulans TaxID=1710 RepID=UPI002096FB8A|nr:hypothetical protein [Cellulosimicrobium cellulans]MCO7274086.1 hypothetical protein [Cellulosimicrobium cellulans]
MKQEESVYRSRLDVGSLRQVLRGACGKAEISPVQFDALDDPPDFSILAEKRGLIGGDSAIQVHINDNGDHRLVLLVALGDSGFARAMQGARNSLSFGGSKKFAATVAEAIRSADPSFQQVG